MPLRLLTCPLCGTNLPCGGAEGQVVVGPSVVEHYRACMEASAHKLKLERYFLVMQKEQDLDDIMDSAGSCQPSMLPRMDLMSLAMEAESTRLKKSEQSRVQIFALLYEDALRRTQIRNELLEVLCLAREEERRKSARECMVCGVKKLPKRLHFLQNCSHHACILCLQDFALRKVETGKCSEIKCHVCSVPLSQHELKSVLGEEDHERYLRASIEEVLLADKERYLACPNVRCKNIIEKVVDPPPNESAIRPYEPNPNEWPRSPLGGDGSKLTLEATIHRERHRFRCRECATECCGSCLAVPYHLGLTCEQYAEWLAAKRCRYCDTALELPRSKCHRPRSRSIKGKERQRRDDDDDESDGEEQDGENGTDQSAEATNSRVLLECCSSAECLAKAKLACAQDLPCGHPCVGICDEETCPPCLHIDCAKKEGMQSDSDLCLICYVEELRAAPCVQLTCGHFFHFECVKSKITKGWSGSRITFGYLECPLCKQLIRHPALDSVLRPTLALFETIKEKALQRLHLLSLDKCQAITSRSSSFYGNPLAYALHRFSFYQCFKCKEPYFGGDKICEADQQAQEFNPRELVCGRCCDLTGINECHDHGREFIEYKCRFCCSTAVWFCWGTTHFCDACHQKAPELITANKCDLPPCTCKIDHPPNGEEFSLGCSYCRALRG
jgi:hypothetical protein